MSHYSETSTSRMHRGLIWLRVDKPLSCVKPPMMAMLMSWHLIGSLAALLLMSFERCYVLMMFWLMMRPPRYEEVIIWMELAHQLIDVGVDRLS
ncbi:hypothetical protein IMY05_009G0047700 [Salix suchowensis]|nr:hypothetical protein IMY05_009G0047700 [Salix suchowensis]